MLLVQSDCVPTLCHHVQLQAATINEVTLLIQTQRQDYVQPGMATA